MNAYLIPETLSFFMGGDFLFNDARDLSNKCSRFHFWIHPPGMLSVCFHQLHLMLSLDLSCYHLLWFLFLLSIIFMRWNNSWARNGQMAYQFFVACTEQMTNNTNERWPPYFERSPRNKLSCFASSSIALFKLAICNRLPISTSHLYCEVSDCPLTCWPWDNKPVSRCHNVSTTPEIQRHKSPWCLWDRRPAFNASAPGRPLFPYKTRPSGTSALARGLSWRIHHESGHSTQWHAGRHVWWIRLSRLISVTGTRCAHFHRWQHASLSRQVCTVGRFW